MPQQIRIEGMKQIRATLKELESDLKREPQRINKEAAVLVADTARSQTTPRRSGRLAASVKPGASGARAFVKSSLVYSAVIHFGWPHHHIKPNPYLYKALDSRIDDVYALYEKRVAELVDKVRGL